MLEDGHVLSAVNEERLNRRKMFWGPPLLSMQAALEIAGVEPRAIDCVAQSSITGGGGVHDDFMHPPTVKKFVEVISTLPFSHTDFVKNGYLQVSKRFRKDAIVDDRLRHLGIRAAKRYMEHHHCHATTAYYCAPFVATPQDVLVVTADGVGDGICHSVNTVASNHKIIRQHESMIFHSIAEIYGYVTHNLGFRYNRHEGKITGLAAYGDPEKTLPIFRSIMGFDPKTLKLRSRLRAWGRPGARKLHLLLQGYKREDIASGLQRAVEEVISGMITTAVRRYEKRLVCLAGGLFSNVRLNQFIREIPEVEEVYVHPGMGDTGQGLGAALALWACLESSPKPVPLRNVYLGPSYDDIEIETALREARVVYRRAKDIHAETAELLARKLVVARLVGRMEYGPRALGHRTIYFHAADRSVNDWLNKRLQRTEFMPFAPIVLRERAGEFFVDWDPDHSAAANFMTMTYNVTRKGLEVAPAAVHVDDTARPQTVTREDNPDAYAILAAYEACTGVPLLINTSFNMHEEPIVCTPADAVRAFLQGHLDALAIGNFIARHPDRID